MRGGLLYMFETLNPNKNRCIDGEHLRHHLWPLDVR